MDDTQIDYVSLMGREEAKRRFSEDVVDTELRDSIRVQKMFRQIQREVRGCRINRLDTDTKLCLWTTHTYRRSHIWPGSIRIP